MNIGSEYQQNHVRIMLQLTTSFTGKALETVVINSAVISVLTPWIWNYYHFLIEFVPRSVHYDR